MMMKTVFIWGVADAVITKTKNGDPVVEAKISADSAKAISHLVHADHAYRDSAFFLNALHTAQNQLATDLSQMEDGEKYLTEMADMIAAAKLQVEKIADEVSTKVAADAKAEVEKEADAAESRVKSLQASMLTPPKSEFAVPSPSAVLSTKPYMDALGEAAGVMGVHRSVAQGLAIEARAYQRQARDKKMMMSGCKDAACKNAILNKVEELNGKAESLMKDARANWENAQGIFGNLGWYGAAAGQAAYRTSVVNDPNAPLLPNFAQPTFQ